MPDSVPPHGDALNIDKVRRFPRKRLCRNLRGTSGVRMRML